MQHSETYGLSRSPIRAVFQKTPRNLFNKRLVDILRSKWDSIPMFITIDKSWNQASSVSGGADYKQNHQQQWLKMK